jgi:channel protein (hemolysin III family)
MCAFSQTRRHLPLQGTLLVAAGGVIYTVGGTIYAFKWPNPSPKYFGYHEIFHAATLLASICHFAAVSAAPNGVQLMLASFSVRRSTLE